jgi:hypothetical protein
MENDFLCPKCRSLLNISDKIVLSVRLMNKQNGLLLFEKILGDYTVKKQDVLLYKNGDLVEFYCPICHESLHSTLHENLVKLIMVDPDDNESEIYFSRIAGEKATYRIFQNKLEVFGKDQANYSYIFQSFK